jgi:hypothetical protein
VPGDITGAPCYVRGVNTETRFSKFGGGGGLDLRMMILLCKNYCCKIQRN